MTSTAQMTDSTNLPEKQDGPVRIHGHAVTKPLGLALAALGIVFGDIGTSPLYTFKTVLALSGGHADAEAVIGLLSLIVWTLVIIPTLKYVALAMSIDNGGEGGILALMSLVTARKHRRVIVACGLFGAALIYGDGAITPAISVLSALEGLDMVTPSVEPYVLPGAVAILVLLFVVQPLGTERIGKAFGPIMALWFAALALLGVGGLARHPSVLAAVNPLHGIGFLLHHGLAGYFVLGGVFLCVTGAEALYADMGHFGPTPIRCSWAGIVLPGLFLNYAGQAALALEGVPEDGNIFFKLCPGFLLVPMVILATLATTIASQSIITGAFSMTRQAIQLGWLPRLAVKQTSSEGYGQIYVGSVNWLLMVVTVAIALTFRKSDSLASAYGIAVALTMALTSVLLFFAMRDVLGWPAVLAAIVAAILLLVDASFLSANLVKIAEGGYVPLAVAAVVSLVIYVWHRGAQAVFARLSEDDLSLDAFTADATGRNTPRVPGTGVFLTRTGRDTPPLLVWHLNRIKALPEHILVLTVKSAPTPHVDSDKRLSVRHVGPGFWRAQATFGFLDYPDIPALLDSARDHNCDLAFEDATYYVGHATVTSRRDQQGIPRWQEALFAAMQRNACHVGDVLSLPQERTVELGRPIAI